MAEEESELELDRFKEELENLLYTGTGDERGLQSKFYCAKFCELVEEYTGRWQVPLPQLQVLRSALCAFVHGTASFPSDCEHVRYTLSSLALSVFELLLFFGRDEFPEDPLKDILDSFQECQSSLVRYQNVYLLQVKHVIRDGGPWASPILDGILKELEQPQEEVNRYLSSEVSLFFELRVRYLLACERIREAMALAQRCSQHPAAGRHLYFRQAYLSCLWKSSLHDHLITEMAEIDGKDAVEILCIAENEEKDEFLLELSKGFLWQQLRSGDMYHLWDLVFIWCKLYIRMNGSRNFLQECRQLILTATNVKAVFPFVKVILTEQLGKEGFIFCVELCAQALQTDLKNDPVTKSLLYKTIACLFPNDLEICRACALLAFFQERTVEAYKTVFLLYNHPDQEYHLDASPIGNNVRFEVIQILKKGLFFDPEFWNLLNLKTNCLKLMSDEVARAALFEIMEEDKWVPNYCSQGRCMCHPEVQRTTVKQETKPTSSHKPESGMLAKQGSPVSGNEQSEPNLSKSSRRRRSSQITNDIEYFPVRRSFRQLDLARNHARPRNPKYQRFHTRQMDMSILKRRGRRPRWLVEQLAAQAEHNAASQEKRPVKTPKLLDLQTGVLDETPVIEITMEYSYPDNEVELPANVQGLSISKLTSTEAKATSAPCAGTSSALPQFLLEDSTHWQDNDKITECVQLWEVIANIRTFHSYATASEDEANPPDAPSVSVVKAAPTVEDDLSLDLHVPVRNLNEPMKVYTVKNKMTAQTAPITKQISATVEHSSEAHILEMQPSSELSSVPPIEQGVFQDRALNTLENGVVHQPQDKTPLMADTNQKTEMTADSISAFGSNPEKTTDHSTSESVSEKVADVSPTSDVVPEMGTTIPSPELVPQRTSDVPAYEQVHVTAGGATAISTNVSIAEGSPKTLDSQPVSKQAATPDLLKDSRPSTTSSPCEPDPQPIVQLVHRCRLCSEECTESSVLNHALWHYRTEKNCMFCSTFTCASGALCHFKKHIKDLEMIDHPLETKKPDADPEKPDQTVPKPPQKKPMPGLAQIKSKLLMRLKLNSKASTRQETEKSSNANGKPLVEEKELTKPPAEEPQQSEKKNDQQNNLKEKIRYMTRGSVRRTEHKVRFLRKRLSRKAKARATKADGDKSLPKDSSGHRANGVIRKKRKMNHKEIREENSKEQTETMKASSGVKSKQEAAESSTLEERSLNCSKLAPSEALDAKKKKRKATEQKDCVKDDNVDEKEVKKRKLSARPNGAGQKRRTGAANVQDVATAVMNTTKEENGAKPDSNENVKVGSAYTMIRCPVETCVFQARANALLSHALVHHPDDRKTLELYYDLTAKKNCVLCSRRIWTRQHFLDHIVSHKGNFKHPCYHVDCTERFKTRLALMEHTLKAHQPLKAACSFTDCTLHFDCLKSLYNHERDHYKKPFSPALHIEKGLEEETNPIEATPKTTVTTPQQTPKSTDTAPSEEGTEQRSVLPVKKDENPLMLNRGSVNYSNKNPRLVNGHSNHEKEPCNNKATPKPTKDDPKGRPVTVKPFVRPPPSSYLDELFLSMPKRWKEPHVSPKGSVPSIDSTANRQRCSRCSATFDSEEELKLHREKCTSLFGFDSDDENSP